MTQAASEMGPSQPTSATNWTQKATWRASPPRTTWVEASSSS